MNDILEKLSISEQNFGSCVGGHDWNENTKDGIFKIAKREDFVGEYLGQTAIKTKKLLKSCLGGVLFIDEAYALGPGQKDRDSFSKEAIDTLNAFLSENKDNFCCIIAGYENDIKMKISFLFSISFENFPTNN